MKTQKLAIGIATALLVVGTTGCGKVADKVGKKVTEKGLEKTIEHQSGGKVDIDSDDGGLRMKTKDGSEYQLGSGSKLPDDWPKLLALPEGFKVAMSTTMQIDESPRSTVTATGKGDPKKIYTTFKKRIESAGYEIDSESSMGAGGDSSMERFAATKADSRLSVMVSADSDKGEVALSLVTSAATEDD